MQIMPEEKIAPCKKGMVESIELDGALERLTPDIEKIVQGALEPPEEIVPLTERLLDQMEKVLEGVVEAHVKDHTCPLCSKVGLRIFGVRRISWSLAGSKMVHSIRVECTECLKYLEKEAEAQDMAGLYVLAGDSVDVDDNP